MGSRMLQQAGETTDRLFAVSAWLDAPYFTDAERAALALGEAVTRLCDRTGGTPDEVWREAAAHYYDRDAHKIPEDLAGRHERQPTTDTRPSGWSVV